MKLIINLKKLFALTLFVATSFLNAQNVIGYMPYWAGSASDIQYTKLTHINYSFAIPDVDGHLKPLQNAAKLQQIVQNAHAVGTKVLIAIGGWSENGVQLDSRFETIGANAQYRTNLVNDIVTMVNQYNLDGADMDWEFPNAGSSADNFEALMTELYNALHPNGKLVTAAVSGSSWGGDGINTNVRNVVDWLNIMAYDFNNYQHSTYSDAINAVNLYNNKGFPYSQLALGVPFYGRPSWESYSALVGRGADPYQDVFDGNGYNGITTIKQKTNYVIQNGLRGVMIWEISQDLTNQYSLVTAIDEEISNNGSQNELPSVALTSPVNGSTYIEGNTIQLTASASDNDGNITKVEFYHGTTKLGEDATAPYEFSFPNVTTGGYEFSAVAYDNAGGSATSPASSVTVNMDPTACNFAEWGNKGWYNPGDYVVYNNHAWLCVNRNRNTTPGTTTDWSDQGQCGGETLNQAPSVSLTSPSVNQQIEEGTTVTLTASASDADGSVANVAFYLNGTKVSDDASAPYSYNAGALVAGLYTVYAVATDNEGATTTATTISFDVNAPVQNQAPTVSVTGPANNAQVEEGNAVTLTASASDADGSVANVAFYLNGTKVSDDASAPYSYNSGALAAGLYTVYAVATDNEGATTTATTISFDVNAPVQNQAPTVSVTGPANNAQIDEGNAVTLTASASDADGSVANVAFYLNGTKVSDDASVPYSYNAGALAAGLYTVYAVATDNEGTTTTASTISFDVNQVIVSECNAPAYVHGNIYVGGDEVAHNGKLWKAKWWTQNEEPGSANPTGVWEDLGNCSGGNQNAAPSVTITSPVNNDSFDEGTLIIVQVDASDSDGSVSKVEFYIDGVKMGEDLSAPYTYSWNNTTVGSYVLTAVSIDNEGAKSTSDPVNISVNDVLNNQPPTISITSPNGGATFEAGQDVTMSVDAFDADGSISKVMFYVDGVFVGEDATADFNYTFSGLMEGEHTLSAKAVDNENLASLGLSVVIQVNNTTIGGGCSEPNYAEGTSYNSGEQIQNAGNLYNCEVAGWCGGSAWAYEPGVGLYWDMAWSLVRACSETPQLQDISADFSQTTNSAEININSQVSQNVQIYVYNSVGQIVFNDVVSVNQNMRYALNMASWNSGIYLVQVKGSSNALQAVIAR